MLCRQRLVFIFVLILCSLTTNGEEQRHVEDPSVESAEPVFSTALLDESIESPSLRSEPSPVIQQISTAYVPGEGLTVSMLNGTSQLKLFGQFSTIGVVSTDRPFSAGLPLLMLPPSAFGFNTNTFDLHARQTSFGASFTGAEVNGFRPGATFLGFIQNDSLTSDSYGFLPFNAFGELKNEDWRFAAGLQSDVFNPAKPTIISLGSLFGSGNTGSFRAQVRAERFFAPSEDLQFISQVALSEPVSTIVSGNARIIEDNGWPNIEGRWETGIGPVEKLTGGRSQRPVQVGVSGVIGELRSTRLITAPTDPDSPNRSIVRTWGLGLDAQIVVTDRFGFAGEFFIGEGLGEYNGGIMQSYNTQTQQSLRSRGGWGEAYLYLTEKLHVHTGYGIDAPVQGDLAPTQFAKNQTYFTNIVYDISKSLQFSFEVDYRKTDYIAFDDAEGTIFMTQMLWRF